MLKDAALALSLANLCFIQTWLSLLDYTKNFPSYYQYVAALLSVGLLALLFWVAVRLARRSRSATAWQAARLAFPLALLIPLEGILLLLLSGHRRVIELTLVIVAVALILLSDSQRWSRVIVRGAATITLMLFPFVLITFTQSAWAISSFSEGHTAFPPGDSNSSGNRVVWMIFDEMDYQIAFSTRPATLDLPEFDRLRRESIFATNAYPPADETSLSMPALITGKKISRIAQVNPSQILITYTGSDKAVNWNGEPSIFSRANEAGFSTALAGWYLPYCGVLGSSLNDCGVRNTSGGSLRRSMIKQVLVLIDTMPFGSILARRFGMLQYITQHTTLSMYRDIVANAQNMAVNPD
ncbi:MAG TPA: hypothetical protein VNO70_27410, partial [Blastocatellia bacterium]|nr:hypothetical protein [Blastocatellia bacterium]